MVFHPPPRGGAPPACISSLPVICLFQSTLPRGERRRTDARSIGFERFQSTLPRGERRCSIPTSCLRVRFQSTLPRGERRSTAERSTGRIRFQSTLPRGERPKRHSRVAYPTLFQSTLPRGERPKGTVSDSINTFISIHAPARGATQTITNRLAEQDNFNPRSREGSDKRSHYCPYRVLQFQSTLPRGERLLSNMGLDKFLKFQSTLPRGERRKWIRTRGYST